MDQRHGCGLHSGREKTVWIREGTGGAELSIQDISYTHGSHTSVLSRITRSGIGKNIYSFAGILQKKWGIYLFKGVKIVIGTIRRSAFGDQCQ